MELEKIFAYYISDKIIIQNTQGTHTTQQQKSNNMTFKKWTEKLIDFFLKNTYNLPIGT